MMIFIEKNPGWLTFPVGSQVFNAYYKKGGRVLYSDGSITVFESGNEVFASLTMQLRQSPAEAVDERGQKRDYPAPGEVKKYDGRELKPLFGEREDYGHPNRLLSDESIRLLEEGCKAFFAQCDRMDRLMEQAAPGVKQEMQKAFRESLEKYGMIIKFDPKK